MHFEDYKPHQYDALRVTKASNRSNNKLDMAFHWDDVLKAYVVYVNGDRLVFRNDQVKWLRDKLNEVLLEDTTAGH